MARPYSIDLQTLPATVLEYLEHLKALGICAIEVQGQKHVSATFPEGWAHALEQIGSQELHNFFRPDGQLTLTIISKCVAPCWTRFHFWTLEQLPKNSRDLVLILLETKSHLE